MAMTSSAPLRVIRRMSCVGALLLVVLCVIAQNAVVAVRNSVTVGDPDAVRFLESAATGSGSSAGGAGASACPNATTVAVTASPVGSASSVQVTSSADCKATVVKSAVVDKVVVLDVHSRGIAVVQSVPTDIQTLKLSNNSIASLANVAFSSALLTLDVSNNALTSLANVSLPLSLTHLNVSRNPIASLKTLKLPSSLTHLDLTRLKLTTFEQVALPDALTALNLSGNAITRIAGVAFPKSLAQLSLRTLLGGSSATTAGPSQDAVLNEFEVRQADADLFAKLKGTGFDVPATARVACSDTRAKHLYVRNTLLCVLTNEVFAAKYSSSSSASDSSAAATPAPQRPALDETIDQSRSWFLIGSVVGLGGFVACVFAVALCRASARRIARRAARREQLRKEQPLLAHHHQQQQSALDADAEEDERNWQEQRQRLGTSPGRFGRSSSLSSDARSFATANESPVGAVTHM